MLRMRLGQVVAVLAVALAAAACAVAQPVDVPNGSFERGAGAPDGWKLEGAGRWLETGAAEGARAVVATGKGDDHTFWRCGPLRLEPGGVYCLRFRARNLSGSGGTAICGLDFCNRDLGVLPPAWTDYESFFVAPADADTRQAFLRFGQWHVKGEVAFDDVRLCRAAAVHALRGELTLGAGEGIAADGGGQARSYSFIAPLHSPTGNFSRPLASHRCQFNSGRWCLGDGSEVVYRHGLAGSRQTVAKVDVSITWHSAGELVVQAGTDGKSWRDLGTIEGLGDKSIEIPNDMLPAGDVWVRLTARPPKAAGASGGGKAGCALQVGRYAYASRLDVALPELTGRTDFLVVREIDPRLKLTVEGLGDALPGAGSQIALSLTNVSDKPIAGALTASVAGPAGRSAATARDVTLNPGRQAIQLPYELTAAGMSTLRLAMTGQAVLVAEAILHVPILHDASYGQRLPSPSPAVDLWWCSSGWKVSRVRPAPKAAGERASQGAGEKAKGKANEAVLIRLAANEAEAAQLVIRPAQPLKALAAAPAGPLTAPGGKTIPAASVELLLVRYVNVAQPTDGTGCVGAWPDPLPPFGGPRQAQPALSLPKGGPVDLAAGQNQPLWVRVKVPKGTPPGVYAGSVRLTARAEGGDFQADVPIRVEVYGFELPDRMTCVTSFGLDAGNIWRYHKLTDPAQRRAVFEKYLACLSAHHISPYDPAPLDHFRVTWKDKTSCQIDWAAWDAAMGRAIDQYHFNSFTVPIQGMGGGSFHERVDPSLQGFKEDAPEYKAAFTNYCRAVQEHLRQKGWLPYAYVYWFDEPDPKDYQFVMNGFRKLKEAAPDINRMLTEQVEEGLVSGPNIWCPITHNYDHAKAEQRRAHAERFWWYVCCGPKAPYCTLFIDHPATELRVWLWQTFQRKIDGVLVWSTDYWTSSAAYPDKDRPQNPYEDPMGWVSGYSSKAGQRLPWGNGDGRFLYPPEAAADARSEKPVLDGPVDSIRLEMLRDGIEDYEYMAILRKLLAERGPKLPDADRARYAALLEVPAAITKDMTTFTTSPDPIEAHRHAVAKAIEAILRQ